MKSGILLAGCVAAMAAGCALWRGTESLTPEQLQPALDSITGADLAAHVRILSSDRFQGRLPGTSGEKRTVAYLVEQFRRIGVRPGNPDGSYVQPVPLVGIDGRPDLRLRVSGRALRMRRGRDYVAVTARFDREVRVRASDLVFVGYGVVAPEYGWDDFKDVDVRGKTVVMLINDPAIPDPKESGALDEDMFKGKAMTYYGRWTYKYEIAAKQGAAAALIVHETGPAGYPWEVVANSWSGEQFELASADRNRSRLQAQGWITLDKARELFAASGQDFDALKQRALSREFRPVALAARADVHIRNRVREVRSQNVIGRLPGSDPALADEHVIYTAHWDHLGRDAKRRGDGIFNGALDNATGVAGLLEVAEAWARLPQAPRRSVLFLAVTAEEQGLLGARHYATHPLYPLERTVGVINMDGLNPWGATRDIEVIGMGQNTLEDVLAEVVRARGREILPDSNPEKGYYYRSDQFEFAKVGVPALYADSGSDVIGKPRGYGQQKRDEYVANDYHKPSDEMKPDWDLSGAAEDMKLLLEVGVRVAHTPRYPEWKSGSEFKARREAMLGGK